MNLTAILDAMEATATAAYEEHGNGPSHGTASVQVRDADIENQWNTSLRLIGEYFALPGELNGRVVNEGENTDAHVAQKIAYARRNKTNSGASIRELLGNESPWRGAVISADGNCICGFSGYPDELVDVQISSAGIAEYERQVAQG
ncbi:MAG: hypothetical protein LBU38_07740 [Propionibacteriaceae bacterium]|jgi:hypothetical protein|nr:hypothetical protein [Propionibacteriaceae bacterium]